MDYYRLYRGHFGMGFANDTAKSPAIVTFLRDPRQHVLSMFNHALVDRDRGIALHPGIDDKTESLFDYLSQENIRPRMTNVQSRQLCSPICRADIGDQHRRTSGEWETPIAETPGPQRLAEALSSITFVGVQEYFAESLILLALATDLVLPDMGQIYDRKMQLPRPANRQTVTPEADRLITEITASDRELHSSQKRRIEERFDHLSQTLGVAGPPLADATSEQRITTVEHVLAALQPERCPPDLKAGSRLAGQRVSALAEEQAVSMNAGSDAPVSLTFTNHSPQAFFGLTRFIPTDLAPLLVATDDPINRSSQFHHPTWFSANRPCAEFSIKKLRPGRPDAISTGDQATATFMLRAPAVAGTYRERFTLVVEGVDSLADELSFNLTIDVI